MSGQNRRHDAEFSVTTGANKPKLLDQVRDVMRRKHYSISRLPFQPSWISGGISGFGGLVLIVVNGYVDTVVGQFESDSSTNATRASGDQRVFSAQRHIC